MSDLAAAGYVRLKPQIYAPGYQLPHEPGLIAEYVHHSRISCISEFDDGKIYAYIGPEDRGGYWARREVFTDAA